MTWNPQELATIARAEELRVSSRRQDGSYSRPVIVWSVQVGDDLFIRSVYGPDKPWYRSVTLRGVGRITAGGLTKDVTFETPITDNLDAIDQAYLTKYAHYPSIVPSCVNSLARGTTTRILPA